MNITGLYIVNEFDRPCERLIARRFTDEATGNDLLEYLHPEQQDHGPMAFTERATPVGAFGIECIIVTREDGTILSGARTGFPATATYSDGKPRKWQGDNSFSILLNPPAARIWSYEHNAWWRPNERGYTEAFTEAGIYPMARAIEIATNANRHADDDKPREAVVPVKGRTF